MKWFTVVALAAILIFAGCKARQQPAPQLSRQIYPEPAQAKADLATALTNASAAHKRVLVDFGGNWCGDCRALDAYFHDAANHSLLEANYVLVHINIGHMDANLDLAARYGVPLDKGVPALAVLDEHGKVLFSQREGQFEAMRSMQSSAVTEFLSEWKPTAPCAASATVTC